MFDEYGECEGCGALDDLINGFCPECGLDPELDEDFDDDDEDIYDDEY